MATVQSIDFASVLQRGNIPLVALTFGAIAAVYILASSLYNLFFHPLRRFPGPRFAAATRLQFSYKLLNGTLPFYIKDLHDKYGDVVRIAPDELCYRNAESWKSIYGVQPRGTNNLHKDPRFFVKEVNGEPSLVTANDAVHGQYKRTLSQAFSEKYLREQEHLIQHFCDLLVRGIQKKLTGDGKDAATDTVDIVQWINWCTFDLGSVLLLGESFNCLENSEYHPWVSIVVAFPKAYAYVATPNYYPILAKMLERLIPKSLLQKRLDHHSMIREKVDRRIAQGNSQPDILKVIESHDGTSQEMSREALYSNCEALIIAGSETSGTLLSGLMYHILSTPRVHKKLVQEIRGSFPSEEDMTIPSLRKLEYLAAVVEEGLRMFPPTPTGLPRIVPAEGKVISGEFIPAGTAVSICEWSAFHSSSNFTDPEAFIPERWMGDERFASDKKEAMQPFGMGPRGCLGKVLAHAEVRLVVAKLLWNFDMELRDESRDWLKKSFIYILWAKDPMHVRVTPVKR